MARDEGERPESESRSQSTGEPAESRPGPADSTGTWAYVSPFATSPESFDTTPGPATAATEAAGSSSEGFPSRPTLGSDPLGEQVGRAATPVWGPPPTTAQPTWGGPAPVPGGKPTPRWKTWQKVAAGGALAAVVAMGGVAAVTAANASSSDTATAQAGFAGGAPGSGGSDDLAQPGTQGPRGGLAGAMALTNALHGDFVVSSGTGTQTMRLQTGEITALSGDSLTVTSTDGYVSTYTVDSGVDVSGLTTGDSVRVIGTVGGDTVTATSIQSGTASTGGGLGQGGVPPGQSGQGGMPAPTTS